MAFFGKSEVELKEIANSLDKRQAKLDSLESSLKSTQANLAHEKQLLESAKAQLESDRGTVREQTKQALKAIENERTELLKSSQARLEHEKQLLDEAKAQLESDRATFREQTKQALEAIATEKSECESRRIELSKLEISAKAAFAEKQREAFKEVIEKRMTQMDARQQDLDAAEKHLADRLAALHTNEGEIAKRELAVTEREQKADAGFADKAKALAAEAAQQLKANQTEAERVRKRADALVEDRQQFELAKAELVQREQAVIAAEQKRDAGFADERASLDAELRDRRQKSEAEISAYREQQLSSIEAYVGTLKSKRLEEIAQAEHLERDRIRAEIAAERDAWAKQYHDARKLLEAEQAELEKQKGALSALHSELEGRQCELEANERTLEHKEKRLERQWQKKNDELDDAVMARLEEERKLLEGERQWFRDANDRLRDSLRIQTDLVCAFDQLKRQLGDRDPAEILHELNIKTDELKRLHEELATRPTEEMRERYREMESEIERQKARIEELVSQVSDNEEMVAQAKELRRKNDELNADNKMLSQKADSLEGHAMAMESTKNRAEAELKRHCQAYERQAEVPARYKEIEMPHITSDKIRRSTQEEKNAMEKEGEKAWLNEIATKCEENGFHFHPRILNAFHTAMKTAEWSPLTILAGVSGTGKSELPRLYSHFGGLLFEPLAVQPNWDSQESMLGFFNSIDNKFAAKPVLHFLAQSQQAGNETFERRIERWKRMAPDHLNFDTGKEEDLNLIQALKQSDYPGLKDHVCMILLDEMNIAYPELYFAEFLSKLELRRGMKDELPHIPVDIGAGMPAYKLPLGRNVLWAGTMNQDETTKSLSDKVLDRSIIIYFPRPTTLKRRKELKPLDDGNRGTPLHRATWWNWLSLVPDPVNPKLKVPGSDLDEEYIKPFKTFLEEMNDSLGVVGRALGHRVWQSVEYYMANYPDVRDARQKEDREALVVALHTAFEDQLVQKVMPKLRGIDTTGDSRSKCLDQIRAQLNIGIKGVREIDGKAFNLDEDFGLACTLGHGQFIWQSANYLKETESSVPTYSVSCTGSQPAGSPPQNVTTPQLSEGVHYAIISEATGRCLDAPRGQSDNGVKIQQWTLGSGKNQLWELKKCGDFFAILSADTGKCLDVEGASRSEKAAIVQWDLENTDNQLWKITPESDGYFTIKSKVSDKLLSAPGPTKDRDGGPIRQLSHHGGSNQKWRFDEHP